MANLNDYKIMSYRQHHGIRALSKTMRATAKALLAHQPLRIEIDRETIKSMSKVVAFQPNNLPAHQQNEARQCFCPEFEKLIRGEHAELQPWRMQFWRDFLSVDFFNYANPAIYARAVTDLHCLIPYCGCGDIACYVDEATELEESDIRRIELQYSELCQHNGVQGKITFQVGDWKCSDSFKNENLFWTPHTVRKSEETLPESATADEL